MYEFKKSKTSNLIPYVNNSRTHSDEQVTQLASSMKEFGFTNPVLIDEDGGLIAGHGRVLAAKKLGIEELPSIVLAGLTESQKKAYIIADNRLALNAGWDDDLLKLEIFELNNMDFDLSLTGFDADELAILLDDVNFDPATEEEQGQLDELDPKYIDCPHCGKEFDMRGKS
jgi:ParB family chromosome partitioning protein